MEENIDKKIGGWWNGSSDEGDCYQILTARVQFSRSTWKEQTSPVSCPLAASQENRKYGTCVSHTHTIKIKKLFEKEIFLKKYFLWKHVVQKTAEVRGGWTGQRGCVFFPQIPCLLSLSLKPINIYFSKKWWLWWLIFYLMGSRIASRRGSECLC